MDRKKIFYIAGPLFSNHEKRYLIRLVEILSERLNKFPALTIDKRKDFFVPHRDVGDAGITKSGDENIFKKDIMYLEQSEIVIAWLDGPDIDSGTAAELGYAYAKNKKIFGVLSDARKWRHSNVVGLNNMIWGICQGKIYRVRIYSRKETEERDQSSGEDTDETDRLVRDLYEILRHAREYASIKP
jgi:nucleoside 2-deoxyribosyltransferase